MIICKFRVFETKFEMKILLFLLLSSEPFQHSFHYTRINSHASHALILDHEILYM